MGHALKSACCHCSDGGHSTDCVYSQLFETPVPSDATRLRKYPVAPHPYILRPHSIDADKPNQLVVDALLLGGSRVHSRHLLNALVEAAAKGLGPTRASYKLIKLEDIRPTLEPTAVTETKQHTTRYIISFLSPQLVKYRGQLMDCDRFDLSGWLTNLMRRYNSLRYFHGDGTEPTDTQVQSMLDAFQTVTVTQRDLRWQRAARHSSRQQKHIDQSGLMGQVSVDLGAAAGLVLPLLMSGTYTHVGKSAVMGHGQYQLQSIS